MYETHLPKSDSAESLNADMNRRHFPATEIGGIARMGRGWNPADRGESLEVTMDDGSFFLTKPKKPTKPRNAPGMHESAKRGAPNAFRNAPNRLGKGSGFGKECASDVVIPLIIGWNALARSGGNLTQDSPVELAEKEKENVHM